MAALIEAYRAVILLGVWPDWNTLWIALFISMSLFIIGYSFFKYVEWEFADII
jgi:ABC-type polysaccharide/polyol phosphate export permease